ncbi:unnamed protein product [Caenorhabditis angaria]|uniref:BTB domain-containing protein n=1 Tax=Caenorhabditis angaria TaxID=860376 RepID=A0A9P1IAB9_9PELO|nr:unnamed protein product [Caenorhabditis angaria]
MNIKVEEPEAVSIKPEFPTNPIERSGDVLSAKFENLNKWDGNLKWSENISFGQFVWATGIEIRENNLYSHLKLVSNGLTGKRWLCDLTGERRIVNQENPTQKLSQTSKALFHPAKMEICEKIGEWNIVKEKWMKNNELLIERTLEIFYYDFYDEIVGYHDVIIIVQRRRFFANKGLLSSFSKYFFNKFFIEKIEGDLEIEDIEINAFCQFLAVLCPTSLSVTEQNVILLAILADKFEVPDLQRRCQKFLTENFGKMELIEMADKNSYNYLIEKCVENCGTKEELLEFMKNTRFTQFKESTQLKFHRKLLNFLI